MTTRFRAKNSFLFKKAQLSFEHSNFDVTFEQFFVELCAVRCMASAFSSVWSGSVWNLHIVCMSIFIETNICYNVVSCVVFIGNFFPSPLIASAVHARVTQSKDKTDIKQRNAKGERGGRVGEERILSFDLNFFKKLRVVKSLCGFTLSFRYFFYFNFCPGKNRWKLALHRVDGG